MALQQNQRTRRGVAIGASVLAHVAVLALIGASVPRMILPPTPTLSHDVWLMPRLTLERAAQTRPSKARPAETRASPRAPIEREREPVPSPLSAPVATAEASAPAAAKGAPPLAGADDGQGVQEALRTSVGCDFDKSVHLSPGERERCNQRYGETAHAAPSVSGMDPAKRGRFDAEAEADERRRADRTGPLKELVVPCSGEGSNLGGGCLPDSAILHLHPH
jgi:hypothetical protein